MSEKFTKEGFFDTKRNPKTKEITLKDERTLTIRKMTQGEVDTTRRKYASEDKALEGYRFIVSRCALDTDTKERLFSDNDVQAMNDGDFDVLEEIALEVMLFSGIKVDLKKE